MSLLPTPHLGDRISALLDGQLSEADSERAWAHLADCRVCQQAVERESWIKRRVAGLTYDGLTTAPAGLKGELLGAPQVACTFPVARESRRVVGLALVGGGVLGAAVMGFVAFGAGPADAPTSPQLVSYTQPVTVSPVVYGVRP